MIFKSPKEVILVQVKTDKLIINYRNNTPLKKKRKVLATELLEKEPTGLNNSKTYLNFIVILFSNLSKPSLINHFFGGEKCTAV